MINPYAVLIYPHRYAHCAERKNPTVKKLAHRDPSGNLVTQSIQATGFSPKEEVIRPRPVASTQSMFG